MSVGKLGFLGDNFECCLTFRGIGFDFDLIRNVCLCVCSVRVSVCVSGNGGWKLEN